jgi:hypothetical protein
MTSFDINDSYLLWTDHIYSVPEQKWAFEFVDTIMNDFKSYLGDLEHYLNNFINQQELKRLLDFIDLVLCQTLKQECKRSKNSCDSIFYYAVYKDYLYNKNTMKIRGILELCVFSITSELEKSYEITLNFGNSTIALNLSK